MKSFLDCFPEKKKNPKKKVFIFPKNTDFYSPAFTL